MSAMRHHQPSCDVALATSATAAHEQSYRACRAGVDRARRRMQTITGGPHAPADTRQAAAELTAALREATTAATRLARQSQPPTSSPRGWWRHRHASRAAAPAVARWSTELVRLAEIAVWLRRTTLDELGVHLPTTVRVGTYAANGPHIAGLGFSAGDLAELHEPRIGVDLPAIVDGVDGVDGRNPATSARAAGVPAPALAA
jgi:hypothetical protein